MRPTSMLTAILATCALTSAALAVTTETWVREDATFRVGRFFGTIVTPDGDLSPGLDRFLVARPESGIIWDLLLTGDVLYAATGARGGLIRWDGKDLGAALAGGEGAPELFAITEGDGDLYIATGPRGSIFVANEGDREIRELMKPDAEYVWDLELLSNGDLIVATGLPGRVLRVDPDDPENPEEVWSTGERHVRSLAVGEGDVVYAGTSGSGWLTRLAPGEEPFVVYDAKETEIVDVAVGDDGALWILAAGGSGGAPSPAPANKKEDSSAAQGENGGSPPENGAQRSESQSGEQRRPAARPTTRGGGSVVLLAPDGLSKTLWSDRTETPLAIAPHPDGGMLVGTGSPARVWWLDADGGEGLWYAFEDSRAVSSVVTSSGRIAVATSNPASLWLFGPEADPSPRWTSDVVDASSRATIGRVHAIADAADAEGIEVALRVGNTAEPGPGWTEWTTLDDAAAPPAADGAGLELPPSRFAQVRVSFDPERAPKGRVSRIEMRYRPVNRAPEVKRVDVLPPGVAYRPIPPSSVTSGENPVVELGIPEEATSELDPRGGSWRSKKSFEPGALTLTWEAEDADEDTLRYRVDACRDEGSPCEEWLPLADGLQRRFFSFDSRALDDGVYRFRVTADDALGNYSGDEHRAEGTTRATTIDHTPPVIEQVSAAMLEEGAIDLALSGVDPSGRLARAEVAAPGGRWTPLRPTDGVEDGARESFRARVESEGDERNLTVRLIDAAGNVTIETVPVER